LLFQGDLLECWDMDQYKEKTIETYDRYPDRFDQKFGEYFELYVREGADLFINQLSGKLVLDLGCGPGNHTAYFVSRGLNVLGIDLSRKMVEKTQMKGVFAEVHDIETLDLAGRRFDGVWMYASLLHIPKEKAPDVLLRVHHHLNEGGIFSLAVKEGEGERMETNKNYPNTERLFTYYSNEEIQKLTEPYFTLIHYEKSNVKNTYTFLRYLLKKR